jgi:hypothetical protein
MYWGRLAAAKVRRVLDALHDAAASAQVDLVVATQDEDVFLVAQAERARMPLPWNLLSEHQRRTGTVRSCVFAPLGKA